MPFSRQSRHIDGTIPMTPHFCPGALWLNDKTQEEHMIVTIEDNEVVTISPPEPWKLETSKLLETAVSSWHGTFQEFFEEFTPPSAAEVD